MAGINATKAGAVLVIGELNLDVVVRDDDPMPRFGQVERAVADARVTLGSSAGIFACGLARLGTAVVFAGAVGDDRPGEMASAILRDRGVSTEGVMVQPSQRTGLSIILSSPRDRAILTYRGAISALTAAMVDPSLVRAARHVHVSGYFLLDALRPDLPRLLETARTGGATVSLDTNYDPAEAWDVREILPMVDLFLPNEAEAMAMTNAKTVEQAGEALLEHVPLIVVKRGALGATALRPGEAAVHVPAPEVEVLDATGAGDSFDAGFVYGWLAGWHIDVALRLAVACGSLSTRGVGGIESQPSLEEAMEVAWR